MKLIQLSSSIVRSTPWHLYVVFIFVFQPAGSLAFQLIVLSLFFSLALSLSLHFRSHTSCCLMFTKFSYRLRHHKLFFFFFVCLFILLLLRLVDIKKADVVFHSFLKTKVKNKIYFLFPFSLPLCFPYFLIPFPVINVQLLGCEPIFLLNWANKI